MKCSDCKLWKTEDCRNNPGEKDLDYAEAFACFDLREGYVPSTEAGLDNTGRVYRAPQGGLGIGRSLVIFGMIGLTVPWLVMRIWGYLSSPYSGSIEDSMGAFILGFFLSIISFICGILVLAGWAVVLKCKKGRLPILTKIAILIVIVAPLAGAIMSLVMTIEYGLFFLLASSMFIIYLSPAIFLTFKEKWAWVVAIVSFVLEMAFFFPWTSLSSVWIILPFSFILIPFILVLLDKKNYWLMLERIQSYPEKTAKSCDVSRG